MDGWQRVSIAVALLLAAFLLGFHYGPAAEANAPYPSPDDLAEDYDAQVGERVLLFGRVLDVEGDTATIRIRHEDGTMKMTVTDFDANVEPGGDVQVFGTIQPDQRIEADETVVVNRASSAEWYKYVASGIGALVILYEFFAYWRVDWATVGFEVRDG